MDLSGKVALVTGGSRGIGKAVASRLAGAGARVALVDVVDPEQLEATAREIGGGAIAVRANVVDADDVGAAVSQIEEQLGPIDVLVNNAGITRDGLLIRMTEEAWSAVLDVNLKGVFNMTKAVARGMMKRRGGRVVNIASVVGITGNAGQANYSASKAGVIGFTKSVAKELAARNVLVNAVAPGFIDTDMTRALPEAARETLRKLIPLGRLGAAEDVANAVLFLSSDLASYMTGQVVVVDGGMVM
ncbi:MAG: 3-oxoacyl-[acyl-carrier-protein] reductase [Gemmatimonadetes bacterium]|nr:3-oxoacyl-[acyl-carrier-protein] reductase [Gemmatimonadota bacterium]MCH7715340.1 3-oxoacyl-[acyl-carrier-protein] reductase [Gemmatimonadota bacterium]